MTIEEEILTGSYLEKKRFLFLEEVLYPTDADVGWFFKPK